VKSEQKLSAQQYQQQRGWEKKSKENNSKFKFASKLYLSLQDPIDMFT